MPDLYLAFVRLFLSSGLYIDVFHQVETFSVGDKVKVLEDQSLVENMQHEHRGWVDSTERVSIIALLTG